jgi:hypothetical protein
MRELKRIAFLLENAALHSPGQQLLDRFLIGFPQHGQFEPPRTRVSLWTEKDDAAGLIRQRRDDFGLAVASAQADVLRDADAVVLAGPGITTPDGLIRAAIELAPVQTPIFVHGLLGSTPAAAAELLRLAAGRGSPILAGTATPFAFKLPEVSVPEGAGLREGLIVVQGDFPAAELDGLEGLLPVLERRKHGEGGVERLRSLDAESLWQAGEKGGWSWPLLAAALSRSDTPQGNALVDGRNEDLVGLGLVPKMARHPRGWIFEHADGLRSALLVLDGVVADINFAVSVRGGGIISAQLFRAPLPQQEHYNGLAAALLEFFTTGREPWPLRRSLLEGALIAAMSSPEGRNGRWQSVCAGPESAELSA